MNISITRDEAERIIRDLENGSFFTVVFVKRTTGEERTMNCRQRVTKHLRGGGAKYSFSKKGLVSVYDVQAEGYRSFPLDGLREIRTDKKVYRVA